MVYFTYLVQTKLMLKNWRYPQKSMFTATGGPTDMPFVVLGILCRGCGSVTCNTQPSIYLKHLGHPPVAGILYSSHIVPLDLFCCHCRGSRYLHGIRFLQLCPDIGVSILQTIVGVEQWPEKSQTRGGSLQ